MFNIGAGEMVFILVAALLILGPQRLPELARAIGKFMREFRRQTDEVRNVVEREFYTMDQEFDREPPPRSPAPRPLAPAVPPESALQALPPPPQHPPLPDLGNSHLGSPPLGNTLLPPQEPVMALDPSLARTQALEPVPLHPEPPPASPTEAAADPEGLPRLAPLPGTVARNAPKQS
jgi:sec-independent protein translocase protein TatB